MPFPTLADLLPRRATIERVNTALRLMGRAEIFAKGKTDHYFWSGEAASWPETRIAIRRLDDITVAQIIGEFTRLSGRPALRRRTVERVPLRASAT